MGPQAQFETTKKQKMALCCYQIKEIKLRRRTKKSKPTRGCQRFDPEKCRQTKERSLMNHRDEKDLGERRWVEEMASLITSAACKKGP